MKNDRIDTDRQLIGDSRAADLPPVLKDNDDCDDDLDDPEYWECYAMAVAAQRNKDDRYLAQALREIDENPEQYEKNQALKDNEPDRITTD
jgi:glycosyltransferase involved in cell wall biosynthesis